jgi:hypothetical protein
VDLADPVPASLRPLLRSFVGRAAEIAESGDAA